MRQKLLALLLLLTFALGTLTACGETTQQNAPAQNEDGDDSEGGDDGETEGDDGDD